MGKAVDVEQKENSEIYFIKVHFTQYKTSLWEAFTEAFEGRQKLIEELKHKL